MLLTFIPFLPFLVQPSSSTTMAANIAMKASLVRCGFNDKTSAFIIEQGFNSPSDFLLVTESDLNSMIKTAARYPPDDVAFPFLAIKKLISYRFWAAERLRTGQQVDPGYYTPAEIITALTSLRNSEEREEASKDLEPSKADPLKSVSTWTKFNEKFLNYLGQIRGRAKTPLVYIIRDVAEVTAEARNTVYTDSDDRLVATTLLNGEHFDMDNKRVWRELKTMTVDGGGWTYIKRFGRSENGREAYIALKKQCEGDSAVLTRKAKAYNQIAKARYDGERKTYNFAKYVETHQGAYNDIFDADETEAIPEAKRVRDFLSGINDPLLQSGIDFILSDASFLSNFEQTQQYLGTLVANRKQHNDSRSDRRGVASASTGGQKDIKIEDRWYPMNEWKELSDEQKKQVTNLTAQRRKKGKNKDRKRKAAAVKKKKAKDKDEQPDSSEEEEETDHAGDQFGRAGHTKKGKKSAKK